MPDFALCLSLLIQCNEGACRFYGTRGYVASAVDPGVVSLEREEEFTYRILIKMTGS